MYKLQLSIRALEEIDESRNWYNEKSTGLGVRFEEQVFKGVQQIQKTPLHYPVRQKNKRQRKVKDFPFLIIYQIEKSQKLVVVTSVFHSSRNPKNKY